MLASGSVRLLLPSLGYFGNKDTDQLVVPVGRRIRALHLWIGEPTPAILNLAGLELVANDKPLAVPEGAQVQQSSVHQDNPAFGPHTLLDRKGIHSKTELRPSWTLTLPEPLHVDALRVRNRGDAWGVRSRNLVVEVTYDDGKKRVVYDGRGPETTMLTMLGILALVGAPVTDVPKLVSDPEAARAAFLKRIGVRLVLGELSVDPASGFDPRPALALLRLYEPRSPSPDELRILAAFLLWQRAFSANTSLGSFATCLRTKKDVLALQAAMDELSAAQKRPYYVLTRHGIHPALLRSRAPAYLDHIARLSALLEAQGREPMIAYGTLLGAVRDGGFIAHDDDVDLLYLARATSRAACEDEVRALAADLRAAGFAVNVNLPAHLNLHVIDKPNGTVLDIFPCWEEEGAIQLHMEKMVVRGMPRERLFPRRTVRFYDRDVPGPADPEAFLLDRYGDGWRTPDRFFEWPWGLAE